MVHSRATRVPHRPDRPRGPAGGPGRQRGPRRDRDPVLGVSAGLVSGRQRHRRQLRQFHSHRRRPEPALHLGGRPRGVVPHQDHQRLQPPGLLPAAVPRPHGDHPRGRRRHGGLPVVAAQCRERGLEPAADRGRPDCRDRRGRRRPHRARRARAGSGPLRPGGRRQRRRRRRALPRGGGDPGRSHDRTSPHHQAAPGRAPLCRRQLHLLGDRVRHGTHLRISGGRVRTPSRGRRSARSRSRASRSGTRAATPWW